MKSYNNLYEKMLDEAYIKQCFWDASEKKRDRRDVREILDEVDEHVKILKRMLVSEMFIPSYHEQSIINENSSKKTRRILKPHYKYEQVVHHCVIGQLKPVVMNGIYEFSCGSIPERGTHYGKKYMRKWIDLYAGRKFYVLKMDVHHFFESINRQVLKKKLKEVIRDRRFYRLLCILIEHDKISCAVRLLADAGIEISEAETKNFIECIALDKANSAMEALMPLGISETLMHEIQKIIMEKKKGVPLGYFTSQWFGNFYLKQLDHYIKEVLHAEHYMRYMDDMVVLGKSKKNLHKMHRAIETYQKDNLDLEIKEDWQVFRFEYPIMEQGEAILDAKGNQITRGRSLDFMGFQFHYNRTTMRKSNLERARRKANHIAKKECISWYNATCMLSYMGMFKHTDTYGYYIAYIKPQINIRKLKRIVSKHGRKEQEANERMEESDWITETGRDRPDVIANDSLSAQEH